MNIKLILLCLLSSVLVTVYAQDEFVDSSLFDENFDEDLQPEVSPRAYTKTIVKGLTKGSHKQPVKVSHEQPPKASYKEPSKASHKKPVKVSYEEPPKESYEEPSKGSYYEQPVEPSHKLNLKKKLNHKMQGLKKKWKDTKSEIQASLKKLEFGKLDKDSEVVYQRPIVTIYSRPVEKTPKPALIPARPKVSSKCKKFMNILLG